MLQRLYQAVQALAGSMLHAVCMALLLVIPALTAVLRHTAASVVLFASVKPGGMERTGGIHADNAVAQAVRNGCCFSFVTG